ncbi:hypothetical protein EVAR_103887_1 [Eumeta japonica]|uniref:Uncharacterized protein n=1 Tax=Eumeta variegata TaxID=151549 RepID=A0A4C1ZMV7_EUMVA|nr:hypothetical protein EVAR_103887_1 [Eumeta japonica]
MKRNACLPIRLDQCGILVPTRMYNSENWLWNSYVRERCSLKQDVVTGVEKGMFAAVWPSGEESRQAKEIYGADVSDLMVSQGDALVNLSWNKLAAC